MLSYEEFCKRAKRHGIYDVAFSQDFFYQIKENVPYDVSTIAFLTNRADKTVRKWFSEGKIRYIYTHPYTASGKDLKNFLYRKEEKRLKKKFPYIFDSEKQN